MKKSVVFLIAALAFFAGLSGGILSGFILAPVKKGFRTNITVNGSVRLPGKKSRKKKKKKISAPGYFLKNIPAAAGSGDNKKRKGNKKWIGQK